MNKLSKKITGGVMAALVSCGIFGMGALEVHAQSGNPDADKAKKQIVAKNVETNEAKSTLKASGQAAGAQTAVQEEQVKKAANQDKNDQVIAKAQAQGQVQTQTNEKKDNAQKETGVTAKEIQKAVEAKQEENVLAKTKAATNTDTSAPAADEIKAKAQ